MRSLRPTLPFLLVAVVGLLAFNQSAEAGC
jgi:hypothetical protein